VSPLTSRHVCISASAVLDTLVATLDGHYELRLVEDREKANYLDKARFSYVDIPDGSDLRAVIVGRSTIGEQPVDVVTLVVDAQPHPLSVKFIGLDGQLQGDVSAEEAAAVFSSTAG